MTEAAIDQLATPPSAPDWSLLSETIRCPLCQYDLRGLIEPRCPECGYRFDWPDLLDPAKRVHPYLFESPPQRNVRSFLRTWIGQFLPRRFWRKIRPAQAVNARRLL